ncbi:MAG: L-threonylcarbamoyladenylate synthase [Gammaproteobacteria bacterium]|jgi:L-threonylcarbamoyladenylate synthase|nr:L-threonylcarbamoyladenylate synthase [Gammaproteobacteria bacterium]
MASHFAVSYAAHQIRRGGFIFYPTDTVYGLGCDPLNFAAINYLNQLKERESGKGFILLGHTLALFDNYIEPLSASEERNLLQTERPTSWVVPARDSLPEWLSNPEHTLAIRITRHPVVTELCRQLGHPLVSTSANPSGMKPALNALRAHKYFHDKVAALLIDDRHLSGQPSIIKTLDSLLTLRQ